MTYDILEALALIAREKNIDLDVVIANVEESLLAAAKKRYPDLDNLSFKLSRKTGEITMIAVKKVVKTVSDKMTEISLDEAIELDMKLRTLLIRHGISYYNVPTGPDCVDDVVKLLEDSYRR